MLHLIVSGSRHFEDKNRIYHEIIRACKGRPVVIVVGDCKTGVDKWTKEYCLEYNIPFKEFKADWQRLGKAAGPSRNHDMITYANLFNEVELLAMPAIDSTGTDDMIKKCKRYEIKSTIIETWR